MTVHCDEVQKLLAELDLFSEKTLSDAEVLEALPAEAAAHLEGCAHCTAFRRALSEVDLQLQALPPIEVPSALLDRTEERIQSLESEAPAPLGIASLVSTTGQALLSGLGAMLGFFLAVGRAAAAFAFLKGERTAEATPKPPAGRQASETRKLHVAGVVLTLGTTSAVGLAATGLYFGTHDSPDSPVGVASIPESSPPPPEEDPGGYVSNSLDLEEGDDAIALAFGMNGPTHSSGLVAELRGREEWIELHGEQPQLESLGGEDSTRRPASGTTETDGDLWNDVSEEDQEGEMQNGEGRDWGVHSGRHSVRLRAQGFQEAPEDDFRLSEGDGRLDSSRSLTSEMAGQSRNGTGESTEGIGHRFLAERARHEGVSTQAATGYWANTYLPGDPGLRRLEARLRDSTALLDGTSGLTLASLAEANVQPFDAPRDAAVAVYVHGDRRGAEGPSRMLLQVGVQGIAHRAGRRPALRVAVVLDASESLTEGAQDRIRALLSALSQARQTGDRIEVHAAGPRGGLLVPPGELRHGELTVATQQLFGDGGPEATPTPLPDALRAAIRSVGQSEGPLGSSLVLLVSGRGEHGEALRQAAHVGSLAGVTTSVVGLDETTLTSLERVALSGGGRRTLLSDEATAAPVIRSEIEAVSRVVARQLRLRIRLAPGVELVDILGSRRLDARESSRVRAAERAADLRLANDLGIVADRDADEDGIQIVIPAFFADDAHVILLDVIVPGPGPVVDVGARFKDLVHLRNGSANRTFALGRTHAAPGPLEVAVLKNLLAHEMAQGLRESAQHVANGDRAGAQRRLTETRALLTGIVAVRPELRRDRRIANDVDLTDRYRTALGEAETSETTSTLADSLRYAARVR